MLFIKMMVGDGRIAHTSPTRSVELVAEFHTVHTHSLDFSIFVHLTSGFQPLGVKNENEHENQSLLYSVRKQRRRRLFPGGRGRRRRCCPLKMMSTSC